MPSEDTQFKPGYKGGPGRPPKEHCLTDLLKKALDQPFNDTGKLNKQMVIDKMFEKANDGDPIILKYLFDRIDGKPLQTIEANVNRPHADLSKLSKEERKALANLNRKRNS